MCSVAKKMNKPLSKGEEPLIFRHSSSTIIHPSIQKLNQNKTRHVMLSGDLQWNLEVQKGSTGTER